MSLDPGVVIFTRAGILTNSCVYYRLMIDKDNRNDYNYLFNKIMAELDVELSENSEKDLGDWCAKYCAEVESRKSDMIWFKRQIDWPKSVIEHIRNDNDYVKTTCTTSETGVKSELLFSRSSINDISGRNKDSSRILEHLIKNPQEVPKFRELIEREKSKQVRVYLPEVTVDKALALFVKMRLTQRTYKAMKTFHSREGLAAYPTFNTVLKAANKRLNKAMKTITAVEIEELRALEAQNQPQ